MLNSFGGNETIQPLRLPWTIQRRPLMQSVAAGFDIVQNTQDLDQLNLTRRHILYLSDTRV